LLRKRAPHFSLLGLERGFSLDRSQIFKVRNFTGLQRNTPERAESFRILHT
jgi:hypothetical protein